MKPPRFSLAWLMGAVLFCALAAGGLHGANEIWASGLYSLALCAVVLGLIVGLVRSGKARAGGLGFGLCGLAYLAASMGPWSQPSVGAPPLMTSLLLQHLYPRLHAVSAVTGNQLFVTNSASGWTGSQPANASSTIAYFSTTLPAVAAPTPATANPNDFYRVGHSLMALLLACLGAAISRIVFGQDPGRTRDTHSSPPQASAEDNLGAVRES